MASGIIKCKRKMLWDNLNTTVAFNAQSVDLSDTTFSVFEVVVRYTKDYHLYKSFIVSSLNAWNALDIHNDSGSNTLYSRRIYINGSTAQFDDAAKFVGTSSSETDNDGCIPARIFGIR